jgi:two-component system, LytTR family, response regulator
MFTFDRNDQFCYKIMRIVIVDDEPMARNAIISILKIGFPQVEISGQAETVLSAVELIKKVNPDLVFLDIDLPDGTGFDLLALLQPAKFKIIFVTAHQEFAIKAIKFSALDYILKPVSSIELAASMTKVINDKAIGDIDLKFETLLSNYNSPRKEMRKIVLRTSESIHIVEIEDIIRCESDNNYTTFFLKDNQKILVSKGLKEYDDMLADYGFYRAHQSHLVNINFINRFDKKDGGYLVLADKTHVPVSQRKRQGLLDLFEKM